MDPRIGRFATDLTAGATTEFEKGVLLERFFRDRDLFTYTVDIEPGHSAEDLADWLFTSDSANFRKGYCEQFATAMAVMARAVDVPSRVVLGFTPGETGAGRCGHRAAEERPCLGGALGGRPGMGPVRPHPAQRWGQPGHANVGFDPLEFVPEAEESEPGTAAGDPSIRNLAELLDRAGQLEIPDVSDGSRVAVARSLDLPIWSWVLGGLALILATIPAIKLVRRRRRMARVERGDISAAWEQIVDHLGDLGNPVPEHLTPLEVAADVGSPLRPLAEVYTAVTYGPGEVRSADVSRAVASMRNTELLLKRTHTRWQRLLGLAQAVGQPLAAWPPNSVATSSSLRRRISRKRSLSSSNRVTSSSTDRVISSIATKNASWPSRKASSNWSSLAATRKIV